MELDTSIPSTIVWLTIGRVAPRLGLSPNALRARLARAAVTEGDETVSRPGLGIVAKKIGTHWRVRLVEN